jgi:hypothetical protein
MQAEKHLGNENQNKRETRHSVKVWTSTTTPCQRKPIKAKSEGFWKEKSSNETNHLAP